MSFSVKSTNKLIGKIQSKSNKPDIITKTVNDSDIDDDDIIDNDDEQKQDKPIAKKYVNGLAMRTTNSATMDFL